MELKKMLTIMGGLILLVTTAFAAESYFAKQRDFENLSRDHQIYILENRLDRLQNRKWDFDFKFKTQEASEQDRQDYKGILCDMRKIQRQLDELSGVK